MTAGIITPQQAQALGELLGAAPPEGMPGPNENTEASRGKQDIDIGSITGDLTVALANKIEDQLLADVGYSAAAGGYPIVDTGQTAFYSNTSAISKQKAGDTFFGQDANYIGNQPSYTDNGDGTVTDNVTGLMWAAGSGRKNDVERGG